MNSVSISGGLPFNRLDSTKSAKKESNKRKHSAIQSEGDQVNNEDTAFLLALRADEYSPFSRSTVLNAVGTVCSPSFCFLSFT